MFSHKSFCKRFRSFGRSLGVWLASVVVVGLSCGQAQAADAVLGPVAAKTIPIADAHVHIMAWMDVRELVRFMDRNGIGWAGGVGAARSKHAEAGAVLGSRYILATGMGRWLFLHHALDAAAFENPDTPAVKQALAAIEDDLRERGARAIGEIHVNARTTTPETAARFKTRADSPTLKALFALAGKYHRPLNIHAQWDSDTAREVERLAESNRSARLILAHCGIFATPSQIRAVFERNANVSCDLAYRGSPPKHGRSVEFAVYDERGILGGWKKLIEDYPDRFVVGSDIPQSWEEYESIVHAIRFGLLANLSPATAEKVAYKNAQAWFGLE
jgi:predicted TIM-barrel fold metal-dependent hydrolase